MNILPQGMKGFGGALQETYPLLLTMSQGMRQGQGPFAGAPQGMAAMMQLKAQKQQKKQQRKQQGKARPGDAYSLDVFREALRLYPPVPMMVRTATCPEHFRDRDVPEGAHVVLSPWHLHRHTRLWEKPDDFDPDRWKTENGKTCLREAFMPFSAGPRVCTGAGFAMIEGPLMLAMLVRAFRFSPSPGKVPVPVAHLTVRSEDGIYLRLTRRDLG